MESEVHDHATWKYWVEWFLFPAVVIATAILTWDGPGWLLQAGAGFAAWTLAEYWIHRSVLHTFFWHGTHERHHLNPHEYISFPLWFTPAGLGAIGVGCYFLGIIPSWAGFVLGYCWFILIHHLLHHVELIEGTWLERYSTWHDKHHQGLPVNYGITTNVWDRVFGTFR